MRTVVFGSDRLTSGWAPASRAVAPTGARQLPLRSRASVSGTALVAVTVSLILAACGRGSPSADAGSGGAQPSHPGSAGDASSLPIATAGAGHLELVRFAKCMRSRGEPNFPDPNPQGDFSNYGVNPNTLAFRTANQSCAHDLPSGEPATAAQVAQMNQAFTQLVRFAKCMRSHGVPNYPDPTRPRGGGVMLLIPGINQSAPAFIRAQQDCSGLPGAPHPP